VDGLSLTDFYAAWELFGTPALTGAVIGLVLGLLGVYVVLRRLVFLSAAVSQAASLGVALSFFAAITLGADTWYVPAPSVGALILTFLATLVVAGRHGRSTAWRDAALGLVFLVGAAGTLALGSRIVQELTDIDSLLFGSAVAVLPEDFEIVAWVFGGVLVVHLLWWRGFAAVSFDLPGALVRRLPVSFLELTLFATLALVISLGTRVIGALPVFALSVLPAVVGARLATHLPMALGASAAVGAVAGFYGYLLAFLHDLPVGASQTLVVAAFVLLGEAVRRVPTLPVRLAPGASGALTPRTLQASWLGGLVAVVVAGYVLLRPVLAGVSQALEAPGLVSGALVTGSVVVGVALALVGAVLSFVALRRPRLTVGFVVALAWVVAAGGLDLGEDLVRPVVLGAGLLAVAACHREARHRVARQGTLNVAQGATSTSSRQEPST